MKRGLVVLGLLLLGLPVWVSAAEVKYYDAEQGMLTELRDGRFQLYETSQVGVKPLLAFNAYNQKHRVMLIPAIGNQMAQLRVEDIKTGTVLKTEPLGGSVVKLAYTKDRKHLFVGFKAESKARQFDLLHYDLTRLQAEVLTGFGLQLNDLAVSRDGSEVYCAHTMAGESGKEKETGRGVVTVLTVPGFKVQGQIAVNNYETEQIQVLGADRIALVEIRRMAVLDHPVGDVRLLDVSACKNLDQKDFYAGAFEYQVIPGSEQLLVLNAKLPGQIALGSRASKSACNVIIVRADGIFQKELDDQVVGSQYAEDTGRLTVVMKKSIAIVERDGTVNQFKVKANLVADDATREVTRVCLLQKSGCIAVHNTAQESVTLFKLNQREPLAQIKAGRGTKSFFKDLVGATEVFETVEFGQKLGAVGRKMVSNESPVSVAENPKREGVYLYNRHTNSLMVYDAKFRRIANRQLSDKLVGFYQIGQLDSAALLSTTKGLYRVDFATDQLIPLCQFKHYAVSDAVYVEGANLVYFTDKEVLVFDPTTWKVKSTFDILNKDGKQRQFLVE